MTRGITQSDVFAAADQLLAAGERPTVERIRAALGSGSPNTVIRHLDAWWADAGQRLQARAAVPDLPPPVAELAVALWTLAADAAREQARDQLAAERVGLATEHEQLATERVRLAADAQRHVEALARAEQVLVAQNTHLEGWNARAADWDGERARMLAEVARLAALSNQDRVALDTLRDQHTMFQQQVERERIASAKHVRAVEDRAHAAVDAARRELKALKQTLGVATRERARRDTTHAREIVALTKAKTVLEGEAARLQGRVQALEAALTALKPVPRAKTKTTNAAVAGKARARKKQGT